MKHHLKHMAIGAGVVLAVLLALRVDLGTALQYALLLACPLGMVVMMVVMGRHGRAGTGAGGDARHGGADGAGEHAEHAGRVDRVDRVAPGRGEGRSPVA